MHVLGKFKLGRRHMLRGTLAGAAVAVGLPPLEAMVGRSGNARAGGGGDDPLRFISFMFGNGVQLRRFEPEQVGADWELSEQLAPFDPVKDYLTICSGMRNRTGSIPITHHEGMCIFSGYDYADSNAGGFASNWGGPTIDQVIADLVAEQVQTPVRSMQVGVTKFDSPADNGTAAKSISARGEPGSLTVLYPEQNPQRVWDGVFGEFEQPKDDSELRLSVLDAVRQDVKALQKRLGQADKQRLAAHLENVRELENKIAALPPSCDLPEQPEHANDEDNGQEQLRLTNQIMSDLIAYAFVCDITRVASNLFCSVASESVFADVPESSTTHHVHSHSDDEGYHRNIIFIMQCLADLMVTLQETDDSMGGNLLDSTLIFASSELSQGWSHSYQRQPMLIGGHARGHLVHPGIHYQAIARTGDNDDQTSAGNSTDVLLALARAFDPGLNAIGAGAMRSTTPLADILA